MPVYQQNMQEVREFGSTISRGWHRFRVECLGERDSVNSPGEKIFSFNLVCQDEPEVGAPLFYPAPLKTTGLMGLKALYRACGYNPGPEGHDPQTIDSGEFYGKVDWEDYNPDSKRGVQMTDRQEVVQEGHQIRSKIAPWNFRTLKDGIPSH